ncbi:MAG TPA: T9SS type A sorting domain-containing protein, partial [Bacteroidales bacterium]|nr:T9SS type A sorting domain-containing protein [Bacteroidales bacterium]
GTTSVIITVEDDAANTVTCESSVEVLYEVPNIWSVKPSDYLYNGQITAEVKIDKAEISNGTLAAFVGEECRGVVDILYFAPSDHYVFDLLTYSNASSEEFLTFKYFDPVNNKVYELHDSIEFRPDMIKGNALNPIEMNYYKNFTRTFVPGWNWFSFNVEPADPTISEIFEAQFQEGDYLKSQTQSATYYDGTGWFGQLSSLESGKLYKAFFTDTVVVTINGYSLDIENIPINLVSGWNWIGYLPQDTLPVAQALASLELTELDYIKSQTNAALYYEGFGWFGGLTELRPGEGYMIQLNNDDELLFTSNGSAKKGSNVPARQDFEEYIDPTNFEYNGTLTAVVQSSNTDNYVGSEDDMLLAYVENEYRGVVKGKYFSPTQNYVYQMMLHSNVARGEKINFRYFDAENEMMYNIDETLNFETDMVEANAFQPFRLTINDQLSEIHENSVKTLPFISAYPNPFRSEVNISYSIDQNASVKIEVYNLSGNMIETLENNVMPEGDYNYRWNPGENPSGMYLIRVLIDDKSTVKKITYIN